MVAPFGVSRDSVQKLLGLAQHLGRIGTERITGQIIGAAHTAAVLGGATLICFRNRATAVKRAGEVLSGTLRLRASLLAIAGGQSSQVNARQGLWQGGRRLVVRSEEHTSELQSRFDLVCRLLLEKKKKDI